jgi:aspartate/methionine/tyrosine aminotransferase
MSDAEAINHRLELEAPALFRALSPLGRRAFYPQDIPYQARQARDAEYNGTIGIFTDGHGGAVPLPSMEAMVNMTEEERNRAFLYSPVPGFAELRERWRDFQQEGHGEHLVTTLPLVTAGLAHGLSLAADLFGGEGRRLAIATPFWGNYRQVFGLRTGAEVCGAPAFRDCTWDPRVYAAILADLPPGEPALVLINFPSNPGGYSPTVEERRALRASLVRIAEERPLVVLCDDAYHGFVFEKSIPRTSFFWDLVGAHEQLIPLKIDGATKEFSFFGGRVGFITFGLDLSEEAAAALEGKLMSLVRSTIGSTVALSQVILLQALRSGKAREEIGAIFREAEARYHIVKPALAALDSSLLRPLPFNAGFFALMEIPEELGIKADEVRQHLLKHYSTGVVSIGERYIRLATCSVAQEDLLELVARLERGIRELAGRTVTVG